MKTEIPLFKESLQKGATAAARAALINANLNSSNRTHADTVRNGLVKFRDALASAYEATKSFKGVVQGLPRMTAVLNKAKRDTAMVLQDLLDSMAEKPPNRHRNDQVSRYQDWLAARGRRG